MDIVERIEQSQKSNKMSLSIYLKGKEQEVECYACGRPHMEQENLYDANITHNLGEMAKEAGIYKHLWRPEELEISLAKDLIEPLELGLTDLKNRPAYFERFDSQNGWGLYIHFVPFVEKYLDACKKHPDATIEISR